MFFLEGRQNFVIWHSYESLDTLFALTILNRTLKRSSENFEISIKNTKVPRKILKFWIDFFYFARILNKMNFIGYGSLLEISLD